MIIIIEGCDKVGKSYLANYIKEKFGFKYIKCNQPKEDAFSEYIDILNSIKSDTVIDRFHLGENVYGPIYREKSSLNDEQFKLIEKFAIEKNAILIYCLDSPYNIAKRFKEENEKFAKIEDIKKILEAYAEQIKKTKIKWYKHRMKTSKDLILSNKIEDLITTYKLVE